MAQTSKDKYSNRSSNSKASSPSGKTKKDKESHRDRKCDYGSADDADGDDDEEIFTDSDGDEEETVDQTKFKALMAKLYKSKNIENKLKKNEKIEKSSKGDKSSKSVKDKDGKSSKASNRDTSDSDVEPHMTTRSKSVRPNKKKGRGRHIVETESEPEEDDDDTSESSDDEAGQGFQKFNLIFTIGGKNKGTVGLLDDYEDEYDDSDYEYCEYEDDDEDEDEDEDDDEDEADDDDEDDDNALKKKKKSKTSSNYTKDDIENTKGLIANLREQLKTKPNDVTRDLLGATEKKFKEIEKIYKNGIHKTQSKNAKSFRKLLSDKNVMNDFEFFKKMELGEQEKIIRELDEINKISKIDKPYRLTILERDMPPEMKACALKKLNMLRHMEPGGGEFYKIKNWVDTFMKIPFNIYKNMDINVDMGVGACHDFMENAQKTLDSAVYGLNDAKMQIMQLVGQWISNPSATGTAVAIKGPMGTGKTTLVKEGISKILGREFAFIALGGATDSSFLEGHSYTYEGSSWGQIVEILIKCKSMNPVIYFDELDKISDTPKGEEIEGILTHLTDTSQNTEFQDKYFSEVKLDLSKCLFIFSYNDESKINPILRDRMYRIQTDGYNGKQRVVIARDHLLPKIREQIKFTDSDITIDDSVLNYIVDNYTHGEKGVRNLKRCLEIIYTKLNLYRLMKPGTNLFETEMSLDVQFPYVVTTDVVGKLLKKDSKPDFMNSIYV